MKDVKREPDAVKWLDDNRLVVANEGDYEGGSRGFTIFDKTGKVLFESGSSFEHAVAAIGHYPDKRSSAKGIEPEGLEAATFGEDKLFFVLAERASVVGVYKDTGADPELPADPALGRFAGRRRCHSRPQSACDRQRG